ncbi:MAG TPA: hypothetical protein VHW26_10175 [Solirubrobacteraceae bacterium]|nr:hypothetical protein [Solirubrobacteraceae bacterium]
MPSFGLSIGFLSLAQGAIVALPRPRSFPALAGLRNPWWAIVPGGSIVAFVLAVGARPQTAQDLTYLALVGVPVLAAVALAFVCRSGRPLLALAVAPLFVLAWRDPAALAGQASGLVLSALSCVTLGALLAAVAPAPVLKVGIVVMAVIDSILVAGDLLQAPNAVLNAASPGSGLPQLQRVVFGQAVMGYGDIFIAAALGAVLASSWPAQRRAAVLTAGLALVFDLLFFAVPELPATVPVAAALILVELSPRRAGIKLAGVRRLKGTGG